MKPRELGLAITVVVTTTISIFCQGSVVVHDPTRKSPDTKLTTTERALFDSVLPAVRKQVSRDVCDEPEPDIAGVVHGSFTRTGAKEGLIFYQYCQTGNGFGVVGLVLIDGDKVTGNFISDSGWSFGIETVPDIDRNGLDEFTLAFGGGMHQGQGGVGVDLMEFRGGVPKGLGWYRAEAYDETQTTTVWKLTAKPGKPPVFYKQKFLSGENEKYTARGRAVLTKLGSPYSTFDRVK